LIEHGFDVCVLDLRVIEVVPICRSAELADCIEFDEVYQRGFSRVRDGQEGIMIGDHLEQGCRQEESPNQQQRRVSEIGHRLEPASCLCGQSNHCVTFPKTCRQRWATAGLQDDSLVRGARMPARVSFIRLYTWSLIFAELRSNESAYTGGNILTRTWPLRL